MTTDERVRMHARRKYMRELLAKLGLASMSWEEQVAFVDSLKEAMKAAREGK